MITSTYANNDRTRTNNSAVTDLHTSFYGAVIANVDIFSYPDLLSDLSTITSLQRLDISGVFQGGDRNASADPGISSNTDPGRVQEMAVGANHNVIGNGEVVPVFAVKGRGNMDVAAKMTANVAFCRTGRDPPCGHNCFEIAPTLIARDTHSRTARTVESIDSPSTMLAFIGKLSIVWQKWLSSKHLFFLAFVQIRLLCIMAWCWRWRCSSGWGH